MTGDPKSIRVPFMVSEAELDAIDAWRHTHRIGTRAEAIRHLVREGLSKGTPPAQKRSSLHDGPIGVTVGFRR